MVNVFTEYEFEIFRDRKFLLAKASVMAKIKDLLTETRKEIDAMQNNRIMETQAFSKSGKISRGENYLGLPYLVLDYPAIFTKEDIFAFRTMFWWGNYFSVTLQLSGLSLDRLRSGILTGFQKLLGQEMYVCVSASPWQYHFGPDNYQILSDEHRQLVSDATFLKFSKKLDLEEWENLPGFAADFYNMFSRVLM